MAFTFCWEKIQNTLQRGVSEEGEKIYNHSWWLSLNAHKNLEKISKSTGNYSHSSKIRQQYLRVALVSNSSCQSLETVSLFCFVLHMPPKHRVRLVRGTCSVPIHYYLKSICTYAYAVDIFAIYKDLHKYNINHLVSPSFRDVCWPWTPPV